MIIRRRLGDPVTTPAQVGWYTAKSIGLALAFGFLCYQLGKAKR